LLSKIGGESAMNRVKKVMWAVVMAASVGAHTFADEHVTVKDPRVRTDPENVTGPISGVNPDYFANLRAGFKEVYSIAGDIDPGAGLGPRFNGTSCAGCHAYPDVGGSSPRRNPQFAMATAHGARNSVPEFLKVDGPVRAVRLKSGVGLYRDGEV